MKRGGKKANTAAQSKAATKSWDKTIKKASGSKESSKEPSPDIALAALSPKSVKWGKAGKGAAGMLDKLGAQ